MTREQYDAQEKKFNANAYVKIKNIAGGLEVTLYGGDGLPYAGSIVSFDHPKWGCDADGNLIKQSLYGGPLGEFRPSSMETFESVFSKSEDGVLKVQQRNRDWLLTISSPPVYTYDQTATLKYPPYIEGKPVNSN